METKPDFSFNQYIYKFKKKICSRYLFLSCGTRSLVLLIKTSVTAEMKQLQFFLEETITLPLPCQTLDDLEENCGLKITILCFKNLINDGCFICRDKVAAICVRVSKDVIEMC